MKGVTLFENWLVGLSGIDSIGRSGGGWEGRGTVYRFLGKIYKIVVCEGLNGEGRYGV